MGSCRISLLQAPKMGDSRQGGVAHHVHAAPRATACAAGEHGIERPEGVGVAALVADRGKVSGASRSLHVRLAEGRCSTPWRAGGRVAFLQKPFSYDALLAAIQSLLVVGSRQGC